MNTTLPNLSYRNRSMSPTPTFRDYFDRLVDQMKREIRKASDEEAFEAAVVIVKERHGFSPDFGFKAWKNRKYDKKGPKVA